MSTSPRTATPTVTSPSVRVPPLLTGTTYRKETPLGTAYITVNSDERDEPFEVFLNVGKAGSEVAAVSEAMGRLVSLILRMPTTLPPNERLRWVLDEMAGIGGGRPLGFGANRVLSLPDGIAQVLAEHLSELPDTSPRRCRQNNLRCPSTTVPSATSARSVARRPFSTSKAAASATSAAIASASLTASALMSD